MTTIEMEPMRRMVIRVVVGGAVGFGWYNIVGCASGTRPLTSNPYVSTLYDMVGGALVAGSFH